MNSSSASSVMDFVAGCAEAIAQHDIDAILARRKHMLRGARRHGMAVDQQHLSGLGHDLAEQRGEGAVIGHVDLIDAPHGLREVQTPAIDFLAFGDHAGDRAQPAGDPGRRGVHISRKFAGEHAGVELIGFPVHIDVAARRMGAQHGCAVVDAGPEQLVDIAILGLAQGQWREPRLAQKGIRVDAAAMRRVEYRWRQPLRWRQDFERGRAAVGETRHVIRIWSAITIAQRGAPVHRCERRFTRRLPLRT